LSATSVSVGSNTAVGQGALTSITGSNNTGVGVSAGRVSVAGGVFLGYNAGYSENGSNKLNIGNTSTGGILVGDMSTGQLMVNARKNHTTPSASILTSSTFEVYNDYEMGNRGSIPAPVMTSAQRDLIAVQQGAVTRIFPIAMSGGPSGTITVTISGSGTGATATATISNSKLFFTITNGGSGYTPNSTTATVTGTGISTITTYVMVGAQGLQVYCLDCTATDGSTGVNQTYNGSAWKNNW
jgi:hypothetical protein